MLEQHEVDVFICGLFNGEEEVVKQTSGMLQIEKDNSISLVYYERFEGDLEETQNHLTFDMTGDAIKAKLVKLGTVSAIMMFENGMTHDTVYQTPEADFPMKIVTEDIKVAKIDSGLDVEIDYDIVFEGMDPMTNRLKLKVRRKDGFIIT